MSARGRRLRADERRAVTAEAVVELAAEHNPSDITTAAIAQRMGLTQSALFRHFPTRDAILHAAIAWVTECLFARVDSAAQDAPSPLAALEAVFQAHIDFVSEYPGAPIVLLDELQRSGEALPKRTAQTLIHPYGERLRRLLEAGKAQGQLDAELDLKAAAVLFVGIIEGLVLRSLLTSDVACIRRDAPRVFSIYRCGIGSAR